MPELVLASTSPYRRDLLQRLGIPFSIAAPQVDETARAGESAQDLVARLSEAKARAVAAPLTDALIVGSDQVAVLKGKILGKPGDHAGAVAQLSAASQQRVEFLTGLCVLHTASGRAQVDVVSYAVYFRTLTSGEIERYLRRERPYQCAGSFKSEGLGITLFERMEGDDPTALIGLPLILLATMLRGEGIELP